MSVPRRLLWSLAVLLLPSVAAQARPFPPGDLPPELKAWVPWVLEEVPERVCPVVGEEAVCLWPGQLALALTATGGTFTQTGATDREMLFPLPGSEAHWPQDVLVNGRPEAVLTDGDKPAILLQKGEWKITGRLIWKELPESIRVPPTTARIDLAIGGKPVAFPRRDAEGVLWLQAGEGGGAGSETERLDLDVFRKVSDGIPLQVTTHITLRVSGKAREANLGKVLLAGTRPMAVTSELPARLEPSGDLRVQVRAGTFTVEVLARTTGNVAPDSLAPPKLDAPWPEDEIWVWEAAEALRQVSASGPPSIDPSQTSLPQAWRSLPAFIARPGAPLKLETTRRGEPSPPPDKLTLQREIWLDLDGGGYTLRDFLGGALSRTWRLNLDHEGVLGHVAVDGTDQLITDDPTSKRPGVEVRKGDLHLVSEWRIPHRGWQLPAVGWSQDVQSLSATLHLPPGWQLLSASGVDKVPGTWMERWTLLHFFFVLLVSLAVGKLLGWRWGLVALAVLVLCQHESGAPVTVWLSLLGAAGLLRVLPRGRFERVAAGWWWLSVVAMVLVALPFVVDQVRHGLYPQIASAGGEQLASLDSLEQRVSSLNVYDNNKWMDNSNANMRGARGDLAGRLRDVTLAPQAPAPVVQTAVAEPNVDGRMKQEASKEDYGKLGKKDFKRAQKAMQNDPKAVVQTGPGLPSWSWQSWSMSWSGPVDKDHRMRLWLLSPRVNLLLSLLRVALLGLLVAWLVRDGLRRLRARGDAPPPASEASSLSAAAMIAGLGVGLGLLMSPSSALADHPTPEMLEQLKTALTRPPTCRPNCVSTSSLDLRIEAGQLKLVGDVSVGAPATWRVPGPAENWVPRTVSVDGKPTAALALLDDGFLHVRLGPGRHRVEAVGPVSAGDGVTLQLGDKPHRVAATVPGWKVDGLREDGRAESSIQITREIEAGGRKSEGDATGNSYPPWLEITRTIDIAIPWLVHTEVRRVSPPGSPVLARVPLLPGESVTESEMRVEGGEAILSLGRDDTAASWSSTLRETPTVELKAPEGKPWSEVWVLRCSPTWKCKASGLVPVQHQSDGQWQPVFRPWPGESVKLALDRPQGMAGQSITIDGVELRVAPGRRLLTGHLSALVRSSQGGMQTITLPEGARLQNLTVANKTAPIRQEGRNVVVTLRTGLQRIVLDWQQPGGMSVFQRAPEVRLGRDAANARVKIEMPSGRWLLLAGGGPWGPAVLFWGYLLVCVGAAFVLGRLRSSQLKAWQWALLAAGLTQVPAWAALIVVGWFFVLEWRRRQGPLRPWIHDGLLLALLGWSAAMLVALYWAVRRGLLVRPDMQVAGAGSTSGELNWYADRISDGLPQPWVLSLPIWVWRGLMLLWALWLAWSLVRWLPRGWRALSEPGLWRPLRRKKAPPAVPPVAAAPAAPAPPPAAK